jgi:hypothetical protein
MLPPPANTLLCQESSGQIFKCNYNVETLKSGLHVVVMTVYIPANFVIKGTESFRVFKVKVTIHTTYGCQEGYHIIIIAGINQCMPDNSNPPSSECPVGNMTQCPPTPQCGDNLVFNNFTGKYEENGNSPPPECPDGLVMDDFTSKCIKNPYSTPTPGNNITGNSSALAGGHSSKTSSSNNLTQQFLSPPSTPPPTSCPDGSQPDSGGNCPSNQPSPNPSNLNGGNTNNNNNNPPSDNPPTNNSPPPSGNTPSDNDNNNDNNGGNPSSPPSSGENDNSKGNDGGGSDSGSHKAD